MACICTGLAAAAASCSLSPIPVGALGSLDDRIDTVMYGTGPYSSSELGSEFSLEKHNLFDVCQGSSPPETVWRFSSDYDAEVATRRVTQLFEQDGWTQDEGRGQPPGQTLLRAQVDGFDAAVVVSSTEKRAQTIEGTTVLSPGTRPTVTSVTGEILGDEPSC